MAVPTRPASNSPTIHECITVMVSAAGKDAFSLEPMVRAYISKELPADLLDRLAGYDLGVWRGDGPVPRAALLEGVAEARGLLCMLTDPIDAALLDRAPDLVVVSQIAVGVD